MLRHCQNSLQRVMVKRPTSTSIANGAIITPRSVVGDTKRFIRLGTIGMVSHSKSYELIRTTGDRGFFFQSVGRFKSPYRSIQVNQVFFVLGFSVFEIGLNVQ